MPRTTRRQFAKTLTAAGAAFAAAELVAQDKPEEKPPSPLAVALTGLVRAQFGQHLSEVELAQIGKDFQAYTPFVENFRKFELKNADEPDFTFSALADRW